MKLTRLLLASVDVLKPLCLDKNFATYKRTLDHLRTWQLVLPQTVNKATYSVSLQDKEQPQSPHWGPWMFLYENVPQLKYHNPSVEFVVERHNEGDSRIELLTDDGSVRTLATGGLKQKDIQQLLESYCCTDMTQSHS